MRSQFEAFSRQLPLLYLILVINSVAVAITHIGKAPTLLCEYLPFTLCAACVVRLWIWSRRRKMIATLTDHQIAQRLANTIWLTVLLGRTFMQGYHFGKPAPFEPAQSQQLRNATAAITGTQLTSGIAKIGNSA